MAYRAALLTALAVGVAPCAAQGIMVPAPVAPPALPASPLPSPSASVPAPALPSLHEDLLKDLPALPDLDSFSPQIAAWVRMRGAGLARGGEIPEAEEMQAYIRKAGYGILGGEDINAIVIYVLFEAAKGTQEDLKSHMAKFKAINSAKQKSGELVNKINNDSRGQKIDGASPCLVVDCNAASSALAHAAGLRDDARGYQLPANPTWADIKAMTDRLAKDHDSLSEIGDLESLKLQKAMDRQSKIIRVLSNLLKKRSETASGIIQNLK